MPTLPTVSASSSTNAAVTLQQEVPMLLCHYGMSVNLSVYARSHGEFYQCSVCSIPAS